MVGAVLRGRDCAIFLLILRELLVALHITTILSNIRYYILKPKFQLLAPPLALSETHPNTQQAYGLAAAPPGIFE